jgi:hypothetical protein
LADEQTSRELVYLGQVHDQEGLFEALRRLEHVDLNQ